MQVTVAEFSNMSFFPNSVGQMAEWPPDNEQVLDFSGGAIRSAQLGMSARQFAGRIAVRLNVSSESACRIKVGDQTVVADTTNARLAPNQTEYITVKVGSYLAVVASS